VHAGATLEETKRQLDEHAVSVKEIVSPDEPMGIGLWLCAATARQIVDEGWVEGLRDWLGERGLRVFTLNGFPHDDFHEDVVKDRVYRPDWTTVLRSEFTHDLVRILIELLDEGAEGSISTLPIGWPRHREWGERQLEAAAMQLQLAAQILALESESSGHELHLDIEPEPGCVIGRCEEMVEFFQGPLLAMGHEEEIRRHIRVCHDVCHAAVMFEGQDDVLCRYADAGIRVGKVQISNAPRVVMEGDREAAIAMLRRFVESRYLHQTMVANGGERWFFEDLPEALSALDDPRADVDLSAGEWRVHFHVPVYLESIGALGTTRDQILPAIRAAREYHDCRSFEVETYAWGVLPEELRVGTLAEGIARELAWVRDLAEGIT
jgi:hypothetical protein